MCNSKLAVLSSRGGPNLNIEVFGNDSGSQSRGKVVISNHDIAVVNKNCHRNHTVIHDVPLPKVIVSSRLHQHAKCDQDTYRCHVVFNKLPLN